MKELFNGVWTHRFGQVEQHTPQSLRKFAVDKQGLQQLPSNGATPIKIEDIAVRQTVRGMILELPIQADEQIYGFGLQLHRVNHTGRKKVIKVNSDPIADTGDSHAPVPFYVSTAGYGVYVDTSRYATFYCGSNLKKGQSENKKEEEKSIGTSEIELYGYQATEGDRTMVIDIPHVSGVDVYLFEGPNMVTAIQRYNLFSGGGCLPPMWGLGVWYRAYSAAKNEDIERLATDFRENKMPIDVFGIEPGWQTKAYSCSFVWDEGRFPQHQQMIDHLESLNYRVNLWEHLFVHPTSPMYEGLKEYSGDYEVWEGLVPDLSMKEAQEIFSNYHLEEFAKKGISGFKLDECDSSDFVHSNWSFPDVAQFPSGMDGEQMHNQLGTLYQNAILAPYEKLGKRTLSQVRSSGALAAPYPFVLYSDLYDHKVFIRGVVNSGFSGLLWAPEVRQASSAEDLIRRIQTVIFSPHALLNCWRIPNPPWMQVEREKNVAGEFHHNYEEVRALCRQLFEIRMSLLPYLYSSFANYHFSGYPPFRALVMDYPDDEQTYEIDDQYMMGDSLLVAPLTSEQTEREVYLPKGNWYDFWTNERYEGGKHYRFAPELETIPVFVKENTILPFAQPLQNVEKDSQFELTIRCYGENPKPFVLYEDDGETTEYEKGKYNKIILSIDENGNGTIEKIGTYSKKRYKIIDWTFVE